MPRLHCWLVAAAIVGVSSFPGVVSELPAVAAQADSEYLALIRQYANGDIESVASLAAWPESRVRTAAAGLHSITDPRTARTAVMLHSDVAYTSDRERMASFHLGVAQSLLPDSKSARDRTFAARWHGWAAVLSGARRNQVQARRHINEGLGLDERNKDVQLARGILEELTISDAEHNPRGQWNTASVRTRWETRLMVATRAYGEALQLDPRFAEAHLRLGWVLFLNQSSAHAREELQQAIAPGNRAEVRYLAHLFLGAIEDKERHFERGAAEYAAAHSILPSQTSFVALIQAHNRLGHADQARALAAEFAARPPDMFDPWRNFNSGITSGELSEWLRQEATRP